MKKRIGVERLVAAFLDSVFVGIIAGILTVIPVIFVALENGFDGVIEYVYGVNIFAEETSTISLGYGFTIITTMISVTVSFLYFVILPWKKNGQTLGKMIFSIKAIDELGENPTFKQHVLRGIQAWGSYVSVIGFLAFFGGDLMYSLVNGGAGMLINLVIFISAIMVLARTDEKGIHDLIADTSVVRTNFDINQEVTQKTAQFSGWAKVVDEEDDISKLDSFEEVKKPSKPSSDDEWDNDDWD